MTITLNGQFKDFSDSTSLLALVQQTARDPQRVVAEVNGTIIPREQWAGIFIKADDKVELLTFVGGG